jgi:hypothetical protein
VPVIHERCGPATFDIATCLWYTGLEPFTKKPVPIARNLSDRELRGP